MSALSRVFIAAVVAMSSPAIADDSLALLASLRIPVDSGIRFDDHIMGEDSSYPDRSIIDDIELETDEAPASIYQRDSRTLRFRPDFRMRAEFEHQSALMVSGLLSDSAPSVLTELGRVTAGAVPLVVLVNHEFELEDAQKHLPPSSNNRFLFVAHNTIWARDFGPTVIANPKERSMVVDAAYDEGRANDDAVPSEIARLSGTSTRRTGIVIPGGNLLTNGRGLCITTTRLQLENPGRSQREIADGIADTFGADTVAILEPLAGEVTGHVDMFATFTDPHTIVIGEYPRHRDPENSSILDRNAEKLASIRVGNRRLRVKRIPMPSRPDGKWQTFTNVVYANGKLIVPSYESTTAEEEKSIESFYAALLPGWEVHFICADDLISSGGALHCVVSNLGSIQVDANMGQRPPRIRTTIPHQVRRLAGW